MLDDKIVTFCKVKQRLHHSLLGHKCQLTLTLQVLQIEPFPLAMSNDSLGWAPCVRVDWILVGQVGHCEMAVSNIFDTLQLCVYRMARLSSICLF